MPRGQTFGDQPGAAKANSYAKGVRHSTASERRAHTPRPFKGRVRLHTTPSRGGVLKRGRRMGLLGGNEGKGSPCRGA
eukprot:377534-Prorocentrum_minimum.AAC.2